MLQQDAQCIIVCEDGNDARPDPWQCTKSGANMQGFTQNAAPSSATRRTLARGHRAAWSRRETCERESSRRGHRKNGGNGSASARNFIESFDCVKRNDCQAHVPLMAYGCNELLLLLCKCNILLCPPVPSGRAHARLAGGVPRNAKKLTPRMGHPCACGRRCRRFACKNSVILAGCNIGGKNEGWVQRSMSSSQWGQGQAAVTPDRPPSVHEQSGARIAGDTIKVRESAMVGAELTCHAALHATTTAAYYPAVPVTVSG